MLCTRNEGEFDDGRSLVALNWISAQNRSGFSGMVESERLSCRRSSLTAYGYPSKKGDSWDACALREVISEITDRIPHRTQ